MWPLEVIVKNNKEVEDNHYYGEVKADPNCVKCKGNGYYPVNQDRGTYIDFPCDACT
ncbi:MAG: hypothetical protein AABY07_00360 [Nanoarchaeota archaeon]